MNFFLKKRKLGSILLSIYNNCLCNLFQNVLPEFEWTPWFFGHFTSSVWDDINNQKTFLMWFEKYHSIQKKEDWYKISSKYFEKNGGHILLRKYGNLYSVLKTLTPDYDWKPWFFISLPNYFWSSLENQKKFVEWLEKELNIKKYEDWYRITIIQLEAKGASSILLKYHRSIYKLLKAIYPEYDWKPWLFSYTPHLLWNQSNEVITYIEWLQKKFNIQNLDSWYNISSKEISQYYKGKYLLSKYGGLSNLLMYYYPNYNWNWFYNKLFLRKQSPSKSQLRLIQILMELFPKEYFLIDYVHPKIYSYTKKKLELDIFFPFLNLAFEYQVI